MPDESSGEIKKPSSLRRTFFRRDKSPKEIKAERSKSGAPKEPVSRVPRPERPRDRDRHEPENVTPPAREAGGGTPPPRRPTGGTPRDPDEWRRHVNNNIIDWWYTNPHHKVDYVGEGHRREFDVERIPDVELKRELTQVADAHYHFHEAMLIREGNFKETNVEAKMEEGYKGFNGFKDEYWQILFETIPGSADAWRKIEKKTDLLKMGDTAATGGKPIQLYQGEDSEYGRLFVNENWDNLRESVKQELINEKSLGNKEAEVATLIGYDVWAAWGRFAEKTKRVQRPPSKSEPDRKEGFFGGGFDYQTRRNMDVGAYLNYRDGSNSPLAQTMDQMLTVLQNHPDQEVANIFRQRKNIAGWSDFVTSNLGGNGLVRIRREDGSISQEPIIVDPFGRVENGREIIPKDFTPISMENLSVEMIDWGFYKRSEGGGVSAWISADGGDANVTRDKLSGLAAGREIDMAKVKLAIFGDNDRKIDPAWKHLTTQRAEIQGLILDIWSRREQELGYLLDRKNPDYYKRLLQDVDNAFYWGSVREIYEFNDPLNIDEMKEGRNPLKIAKLLVMVHNDETLTSIARELGLNPNAYVAWLKDLADDELGENGLLKPNHLLALDLNQTNPDVQTRLHELAARFGFLSLGTFYEAVIKGPLKIRTGYNYRTDRWKVHAELWDLIHGLQIRDAGWIKEHLRGNFLTRPFTLSQDGRSVIWSDPLLNFLMDPDHIRNQDKKVYWLFPSVLNNFEEAWLENSWDNPNLALSAEAKLSPLLLAWSENTLINLLTNRIAVEKLGVQTVKQLLRRANLDTSWKRFAVGLRDWMFEMPNWAQQTWEKWGEGLTKYLRTAALLIPVPPPSGLNIGISLLGAVGFSAFGGSPALGWILAVYGDRILGIAETIRNNFIRTPNAPRWLRTWDSIYDRKPEELDKMAQRLFGG